MTILDTFVTRKGVFSRFYRRRQAPPAQSTGERPQVSRREMQALFSADLGLVSRRSGLTHCERDQRSATDRFREALYSD